MVECGIGRESGTASDGKRPAAPDEHGHLAEHITRRAWGGVKLEKFARNGPK